MLCDLEELHNWTKKAVAELEKNIKAKIYTPSGMTTEWINSELGDNRKRLQTLLKSVAGQVKSEREAEVLSGAQLEAVHL